MCQTTRVWVNGPACARSTLGLGFNAFPCVSQVSPNHPRSHRGAPWGTKDKDGLPRKVVGTSCVAVVDFGEEGQVQL